MSWYHDYRPQTVSSLHHTKIREDVQRLFAEGRLSHAFLLTGPKGIGKTTTARLFAKAVNCEKNASISFFSTKNTDQKSAKKATSSAIQDPCGTCSSCVAIQRGTSLSVVEMDSASHRGIDDVRELKERAYMSPPDGRVSVFILDEVHMFTQEAFNAFLKLLEEPPAHTMFILATTEFMKVPATIVSRCTVLQFSQASSDEISTMLMQIATAQKITVEDGVISAIADVSEGSFRDAVKLFEQVSACRESVSMQDIEAVGTVQTLSIANTLVSAILEKNLDSCLEVFRTSLVPKQYAIPFQRSVIDVLRKEMVDPACPAQKRRTLAELLRVIVVPMPIGLPDTSIPFEVSCIEWCMGSSEVFVQKKELVEEKITPEKKSIEKVPVEKTVERPVKPPVVEKEQNYPVTAEIQLRWKEIMKIIKASNSTLEGLLRSTKVDRVEDGTCFLASFYAFHKEQIETEKHRSLLEKTLCDLFQLDRFQVRVEIIEKMREKSVETSPTVEQNSDLVTSAEEIFV